MSLDRQNIGGLRTKIISDPQNIGGPPDPIYNAFDLPQNPTSVSAQQASRRKESSPLSRSDPQQTITHEHSPSLPLEDISVSGDFEKELNGPKVGQTLPLNISKKERERLGEREFQTVDLGQDIKEKVVPEPQEIKDCDSSSNYGMDFEKGRKFPSPRMDPIYRSALSPYATDATGMPGQEQSLGLALLRYGCFAVGSAFAILGFCSFVFTLLDHPKIGRLETEVYSIYASAGPSAAQSLTPSPAMTASETSIDPTSVVIVTSRLRESETTTTASESTSKSTSSLRGSSSSFRPSFIESTDNSDSIVRRSGYLNQREEARVWYPDVEEDATAMTTVIGTVYHARSSSFGLRDGAAVHEDCDDDTTITTATTTTTTTTVTSTLHTTPASPSSIEGAHDTETKMPCDPSRVSPTLAPTVESPASTVMSTTSPPSTLGSQNVSATVISSSSSAAAARRLVSPFAWSELQPHNFRLNLRRFFTSPSSSDSNQNRHLLSSLTPPSTSSIPDATAQLLPTTYSNAATLRSYAPWAIPTRQSLRTVGHIRRQTTGSAVTSAVPSPAPSSSGRKLLYWEAYTQLRLQAGQLCFDVSTYLDVSLTPETVQTSQDLQMGATLNQKMCNALEQTFPMVDQGERCGTKTEWEGLKSKVEEVCGEERMGTKLVQDVVLLCAVRDSLGHLDECQEAGERSGTSDGGAATANITTHSSSGMQPSTGSAFVSISNTLLNHGVGSGDLGPSSSPSGSATAVLPQPTGDSGNVPTLATLPPAVTPSDTSILPTSASLPLGVLPPHHSLTPPADWTLPMLTYTTQEPTPAIQRTMPPNDPANPPEWTGAHLSRTWVDLIPFPIPTGYVAPNIVPAEPQIGHLTEFNSGLGACGLPDMLNNELAVAVSWELFDMGREIGGSSLEAKWNPVGSLADGKETGSSALCNRGIRAWLGSADGEGRTVEMEFVVRDRCTGCNVTHIDVQPGIFEKYWGTKEVGRISVTWEWMQEAPTAMP